MQEDVERRTVALSVNATKLTSRAMAKAFVAALRKIQKHRAAKVQEPQGRQSVKRLTRRHDAKSIPLNGATRLFDQVVKEKKLKVDYAFYKTGPDKYLLFFKAGQADTITAAFSEYAKRVMTKSRGVNIGAQLRSFEEQARTQPRQQERKREAVRDER